MKLLYRHQVILVIAGITLFVSITLIVVLARLMALSSETIISETQAILTVQAEGYLSQLARQQSELVRLILEQGLSDVQLAAEIIGSEKDLSKEKIWTFLDSLKKNSGSFSRSAFYVPANQSEIILSGKKESEKIPQAYRFPPTFTSAQLGYAHPDRLSSYKNLVVDVFTPVFQMGRLIGQVGVTISLQEIIYQFRIKQEVLESATFIIDDKGYLIAASPLARSKLVRPAAVGNRGAVNLNVDAVTGTEKIVSEIVLGRDNVAEAVIYNETQILAYTPVKKTPLRLGVILPKSIAIIIANQIHGVLNQEAKKSLITMLFWSFLILSMMLVIAHFLAGNLTSPIIKLSVLAKKLQQGDFTQMISVSRSDEIGELAASFNGMAKELRRSFDILEKKVEERTFELSKANEKLKEAKEQAESSNRAKSDFLANMSHELRTPLNAVLGYAQLLQRGGVGQKERQRHLEIINSSGKHLLALINDVLEVSRIEAGRIRIEPVAFDFKALISDLEAMFRIRTNVKKVRLNTTVAESVPAYAVCDQKKLRQILINLLGNAVKFTDEGGIEVRVAATGSGEDVRLVVEVEDTGPGIAPEEAEKVFESFEQTQSGRKAQIGTGLGLAISREYAHLMGGDISFDSVFGKGSTFRLEVGIREASPADLPADERKRRVTMLVPGQEIPRVLIAEDNDNSRMLLMRLLQGVGFEVRWVADGREAVEAYSQWKPRFIWMDIRMPVMDGLTATRQIKAMPDGVGVVIAALTAHALEEQQEAILAAGCDDCVCKPYREHEIFEVMAKHLGVSYVYEEERASSIPYRELPLTPEQLTTVLPQELRDQLQRAALRLNQTMVLEVAAKIKALEPSLGATLESFAERFDFEGLLALLEVPFPNPEENNERL